MRTIKFRAWDKKWKKWSVSGGDRTLPIGKMSKAADSLDMELSQFTGLLDKSGKEIYEGDIVRMSGGTRVLVEWREENCGFMLGNGATPSSDKDEIIGNIYENPELLKTN